MELHQDTKLATTLSLTQNEIDVGGPSQLQALASSNKHQKHLFSAVLGSSTYYVDAGIQNEVQRRWHRYEGIQLELTMPLNLASPSDGAKMGERLVVRQLNFISGGLLARLQT